jgi:hypothetical protein
MSFMSYPETIKKECPVSSYLKIVEKNKPKKKAEEASPPRPALPNNTPTTKTTDTTKLPVSAPVRKEPPRGKRVPNFTPLTVSEVLAEINRWGSGAGRNTELYRRGELSEARAVEYVTCAILHRRGESFEVWRHHAPAVRKALALCIHELPPEACKVCNGYVKRLIEEGATV